MCLCYSGGLTYADGCRKKVLEEPWIFCKLRPIGRDARSCKEFVFVEFGLHRIEALECPEHEGWEDGDEELMEEESIGRDIVGNDIEHKDEEDDMIVDLIPTLTEEDGFEHDEVLEDDIHLISHETIRSDTSLDSNDTFRTTRFLKFTTSNIRRLSREESDPYTSYQAKTTTRERFGTWPKTGLKLTGRLKGQTRKSLGSLRSDHAKSGLDNLFPTRSSPSINQGFTEYSGHRRKASEDKALQERFVTRLPEPISHHGRANKPRAHLKNKSAQILGLEDEYIERLGGGVQGLGLVVHPAAASGDEGTKMVAALEKVGVI